MNNNNNNTNTTILCLREKKEKEKIIAGLYLARTNWSSALRLQESIRIFTKMAINFAQFC